MRFILNNMIYDTSKMTKVTDVEKWYEVNNFMTAAMYPGKTVGRNYHCELWKSAKGNWLLTHEVDYAKAIGEAITEDEARNLIKKYDYNRYAEMYGELDEA